MSLELARVILTPEHVQVRLVPAGLGSRFIAFIVDQVLILCLLWLVSKLALTIFPLGVAGAASMTLFFALELAYPLYFETRRNGQTPGKGVTRIRVVDGRGLPIGLPQSFIRNTARVVDGFPLFYGLGALACLLDPHSRRLGDLLADTLVIKESRPVEYAGQLLEPRRYNSLRVPRVRRLIRHRIGLEEREFLLALCLRAERLDAKKRFDLMEEVGAHYRDALQIEDPHLSGENLVQGLTAILFGAPESAL